jgi:hypothetical protein
VTLAPPEIPTTHANESEWIKLCKVAQKLGSAQLYTILGNFLHKSIIADISDTALIEKSFHEVPEYYKVHAEYPHRHPIIDE